MKNQHHRTLNWADAVRQAVEKAKPRKTQKLPVKPRKKAESRADGVHWDEWSRKANEPEGRDTGLHRDSVG